MNDMDFIFRIAAIEEEHDDWEDMGPASGEREKRNWRSKSTGEVRIQIIKPTTPSVKDSIKAPTKPQDEANGRKPLVTPEEDEAYLKAVKRGDLGLAQKMVDETAKKHGYNIGPVWRGDAGEKRVNVLDPNRSKYGYDNGPATLFATNKKLADVYDENGDARPFYLKSGNLLTRDIGEGYRGGHWSGIRPVIMNGRQNGHDAVLIKDVTDGPGIRSDVYGVFNSAQMKLGLSVVKDDEGNVVPLSKRFDDSSPDIRGNLKRASLLILSAIEEEHDDWEDMGPAPGEKKKRIWKSKSTGEKRTQIMKPRTPSVMEKVGDGGVEEMEDSEGYNSHSGMLKMVRVLEKEKDKIADKMREFNDKYGSITNPKKAPKSAKKKHEERNVEYEAIKGKIKEVYERIRGRSRNITEVKNTAPWVNMPEDFIDSVLSHDPLSDGVGKRVIKDIGSNAVCFDFDGGGMGSVFKPASGEFTVSNPNFTGGQYKKEAMAYELDSLLELGIVPPTKIVEKKLLVGNSNYKYEGSSQLMVRGERVYAKDFIDRLHEDDKLRQELMKVAIFDYISGNMDRHIGNILWSKENGDVYAIDNGMSFPRNKTNFFGDLNHKPLVFEYLKNIGIDDNMVDEIAKRIDDNKDKIDGIFKKHGFDGPHRNAFWNRVSKLKDINKMMWAAHPPGTRLVK